MTSFRWQEQSVRYIIEPMDSPKERWMDASDCSAADIAINSMLVREAQLADVPAMARAHTRSIHKAYQTILHPDDLALFTVSETEKRITNFLAGDDILFVAELDGVIVGLARWGEVQVEAWPYQNLVHSLFVDPEFQGRGAGKSLLSACAELALSLGHKGTMIGSLKDNIKAWSWYASLGGREVDEEPIEIGSRSYPNVFLAWDDLGDLIGRLT